MTLTIFIVALWCGPLATSLPAPAPGPTLAHRSSLRTYPDSNIEFLIPISVNEHREHHSGVPLNAWINRDQNSHTDQDLTFRYQNLLKNTGHVAKKDLAHHRPHHHLSQEKSYAGQKSPSRIYSTAAPGPSGFLQTRVKSQMIDRGQNGVFEFPSRSLYLQGGKDHGSKFPNVQNVARSIKNVLELLLPELEANGDGCLVMVGRHSDVKVVVVQACSSERSLEEAGRGAIEMPSRRDWTVLREDYPGMMTRFVDSFERPKKFRHFINSL